MIYDFGFLRLLLSLLAGAGRLHWLVALILLSAVLEVLAPLTVYAFLNFENLPISIPLLKNEFIVIVAAAFLLKGLISFYTYHKIYEVAFVLQRLVATRLLREYISMSYSAFRQNTTGVILNQLIKEPGNITFNFTIPTFTIVFELTTLVVLLCACAVLSWKFTLLAILAFIGVATLLLRITRKRIGSLSEVRFRNDQKKTTIANNSLNNFVMQKFNSNEPVISAFSEKCRLSAGAEAAQQSISIVPRFGLETVFVTALVLMAFLVSDSTEAQALLGAFVVIGFRLLPSIIRILSSLQLFKYARTITSELTPLLATKCEGQKLTAPEAVSEIKVDGLSFFVDEIDILRNLSVSFQSDQIHVIFGKTGSGKSTLIKHIAGLYPSKRILYDGAPVSDIDTSRLISYFDQHVFIPETSLSDYLNLDLGAEAPEAVLSLLKELGLERLSHTLSMGLDESLGHSGLNLSGGERQRLALAKIFLEDRPIVILDEPTSGLDKTTESRVVELIATRLVGKLVIIVTHEKLFRTIAHDVLEV